MLHRISLLMITLLALAILTPPRRTAAALRTHTEKPNILFVLTDDQGWKEPGKTPRGSSTCCAAGDTMSRSATADRCDGGTLRLSAGDASLECSPPPTPTPDVFERVRVGTLTLDGGPAILKAEVVNWRGNELMRPEPHLS